VLCTHPRLTDYEIESPVRVAPAIHQPAVVVVQGRSFIYVGDAGACQLCMTRGGGNLPELVELFATVHLVPAR